MIVLIIINFRFIPYFFKRVEKLLKMKEHIITLNLGNNIILNFPENQLITNVMNYSFKSDHL